MAEIVAPLRAPGPRDIPELPQDKAKLDPEVRARLEQMRERVQTLLGFRGDELDKAITRRDAVDLGFLTRDGTFTGGGGGPGIPGPPGPPGSGGGVVTPDLTPPPDVTGLTAAAGLANVIIEWDAAVYAQGHGHQKTNIYAAKRVPADPPAVFADAERVFEATGQLTIAALPSDLSIRWHIWAKYETNDGIESVNPAGGVNGVIAQTGLINGVDLGPLIIEAGHLADGSVTASKIAALAIDATKFANNIEPVTLVSSVPGSLVTRTIFNTADGKLYRWNGSAYVATVPAADIAGTLANAQIASLAASKITGQLTDAQIASIDAAKITGTIPAVLTGQIGGANLLSNSDFSAPYVGTATLGDSWAAYSSGTVTSPSYFRYSTGGVDGGPYQAAGCVSQGAAWTDRVGIFQGPIALLGGGPITLSAYLMGFGGEARFYVEVQNPLGTVLGTFTQAFAPTSSAWTRRSYSFTVPTDAARAFVYVFTDAAGAGTAILVDKVQLEQGDYLTAYAPRPDEILPGTITATAIADNSVTSAKIIAGAVVAGKIAANAISATEIQAGAITTAKLAAAAVTANEIAANAIVAAKIAAGAITTPKLAAGAVTANEIAAGTILAANIAAHTITGAEILALSITSSELAANSVIAGKIAAAAVNAAQIAAGAITTDKLLVTGRGAALNADPAAADVSAWTATGTAQFINTVTDNPGGGATAVQNASGTALTILSSDPIPIDAAKAYRIEMSVKQETGTLATTYLAVAWYDAAGVFLVSTTAQPTGAGSPAGWTNGTYSYFGLTGGVTPSTWTKYTASFGAGETRAIPSNARYVRVGALLNNNVTSAATVRLSSVRLMEKANYDLIVDGAIIASKLAANAIAVGSAAIENGAIVNAMLGNAVIDDAKVANLSAAKLTAGDGTIGGVLKSAGFVAGTSGWIVRPDGTAEFSFAHIRGVLQAGQIAAGYISTTMLAAGAVTAGKISVTNLSAINADAGTLTAGTLTAGTTFAGALSAATGTFAGALSAASGTFAGSLSAATGTFDGTLTAASLILAGQALFQPAYASASSGAVTTNRWATILTSPSVNAGSTGSVAIQATVEWLGVAGAIAGESGDGDPNSLPKFRIIRTISGTDTTLATWAPRASGIAGSSSFTYLDTPGAAATYSLQQIIGSTGDVFNSDTGGRTFYRTILVQGAVR